MPISSLIITYADGHLGDGASDSISCDARIELGMRGGPCLALILETASQDEDEALWKSVHHLPGISHFVVAFASLIEEAVSK